MTGRTPHPHGQYPLSDSCIVKIGAAQPQPGFDLATFSMRGNHLAYAATQGTDARRTRQVLINSRLKKRNATRIAKFKTLLRLQWNRSGINSSSNSSGITAVVVVVPVAATRVTAAATGVTAAATGVTAAATGVTAAAATGVAAAAVTAAVVTSVTAAVASSRGPTMRSFSVSFPC